MRIRSKSTSLGALTALLGACALLVAFASPAAAAGPTTLTFKEPEKGSTFAYVDAAPKTVFKHGNPKMVSAGDELVITQPLEAQGKKLGHLLAVCTATKSTKKFTSADFTCVGTYVFANGTLTASALLGFEKGTEGAITGGTGVYANARGTFASKEGKGASTTTITLVE